MAVFHVSTTGSRSSGASTADDWTDANCYSSIVSAANATTADGDEIIIDDGTYTESTGVTNTVVAVSGTLTIKTRNGAGVVTWTGTQTTNALLVANDATTNWDIQDIQFSKDISTPVNNYNLIIRQNAACTLTLTRCSIADINISGDVITNFQGLLIDKTAGTINIVGGLSVYNITASVNRLSGLLHLKDAITNIDDITFSLINVTQTGAYTSTGLMVIAENVSNTVTHTGTISASNVTIECTNDNGIHEGSIKVSAPSTMNDITIDGVDCTMTLGRCDGIGFYAMGTITANTITVNDCVLHYPATRTQANQTGRSHGSAVYVENTGDLTAKTIKVTACQCTIGPGFYMNGGGTATVGLLDVRNCTSDAHSALYLGGWGDVTIDVLYVVGNTDVNEDRVEVAFGGSIYCYNHENATRNKVLTLNQMTLAGNTINTGDATHPVAALQCRDNGATYTTTVSVNESVIDNGNALEGLIHDPNTYGNLTATIDNSYVNGGSGALTDVTLTDEITGVTLDAGYGLALGSAGVGGSAKWWTGVNPVGANGEPFSDIDTDIGAIQSTYGPFHPVNL